MNKDINCNDGFPLDDMQMAYYVGQQPGLPLSTTARFFREMEFPLFELRRVEDAWNALITRHEMLRAVISHAGQQCVLPDVPHFQIKRYDIRTDSPGVAQDVRRHVIEQMRATQLSVHEWPQFDVRIVVEQDSLRLHIRFNLWTIDAISMQILLAEWLALCEDPRLSLPPLKAYFGDYVLQREKAKHEQPGRALAYWNRRAQTMPLGPVLPLKMSVEDIAVPSFTHLSTSIPTEIWQRFSAFAQAHRITPTFALIAVYVSVLAEWSKHRHFTITILLSKRPFANAEVENVVGNFGTTLLLEIDARTPQSFNGLARSIQAQFWKDIAHIDVSGIEAAREVNRLQGSPLRLLAPVTFTSLMAGNSLSDSQQAALRNIKHVGSHLDVPQVLLDHQVTEEPQGHLTVNWDYVQAAFHEGVVGDMFDAFVQSVEQLSQAQANWTDPLRRTSWPDRQRLAWDKLNATDYPYADVLLDQLVETAVEKHPAHLAVICGDSRLTYSELWRRSSALMKVLCNGGCQQRIVAVILPKGQEQVVAVLGILRAGAAYVPVDPALPKQRQRELIAQCSAAAVITFVGLAAEMDWDAALKVIAIDKLELGTGDDDPTRLSYKMVRSATDIAYVIFTSGSTGTPKGVVIDHRGAVNTILDINRRLGVTEADRVLALSSLSFDLSVFDVFGLLAAGGTIVIPTPREMGSPSDWCRLVDEAGVTLWNSVPALFQLAADAALSCCTTMVSLRNVMLSGDWIPLPLPEQGRLVAPGARLFSLGGATEVSIWSVIHEVGTQNPDWQSVPYGRPLSNQRAYVLDEQSKVCPIWKTGELYLGGIGVARGYLGDELRTQERFLTNVIEGQVLYKTGDLARLRPNGDLEFLGRNDHQIKIRGYRIELGEIEAAMVSCEGVTNAVVKVLGNSDADRQLIAFAVCHGSSMVDADIIREQLLKQLPRYMMPASIHLLRELPLTPNGKIDHAALAAQHFDLAVVADLKAETVSSSTTDISSTTGVLSGLWVTVLGQPVNLNDSFFALGGTSFQALQLIGKIREQFGISLTLDSFSSTVTLQEMTALIDSKPNAVVVRNAITILRDMEKLENRQPLSLFCIHAVGGGVHCYVPLSQHLPAGMRIYGIQRLPGVVDSPDLNSIEALAEYYASMTRRTVPTGPIAVLGWSMGAAVAIETERRLSAAGCDVRLVALIDPYFRPANIARVPSCDPMLEDFCRDLAGISGIPYAVPSDVMEIQNPEERFDACIADLQGRSVLPADAPTEHMRHAFAAFSRNLGALLDYRPSDSDANVLILRAQQALLPDATPLRQWTPQAQSVEEISLDCDHFSIMRPPTIAQIAQILGDRLLFERA